MQIITISGLDGSGKTTQLDLLEKELSLSKKSVYRLHITKFSLANKALGLFKRDKKIKNKPAKAVTKASKTTIYLRKLMLIIDSMRFHLFISSLKAGRMYDFLLIDRYFYDQIVNVHYLKRNFAPKRKSAWQRLVEDIILKPDFSLFIKVDSKIAISRDRDIEQGEQFLKDKQSIFDTFLSDWDIQVIDGNGSIKEVQEEIAKTINLRK